jgi:peptidoglycan hydrolase CwlO-like protein
MMTDKPLKEHYEVDSDVGIMVRTFDYIADLEKYCNSVERDLLSKIASIQMLENNFKEYMTSFESHRDELHTKIASLESQLAEKEGQIKIHKDAMLGQERYLIRRERELSEAKKEASIEAKLAARRESELEKKNYELREALKELFPHASNSGHGIPE